SPSPSDKAEGKPDISSPFFPRRNSLIKTSAEIVSEVRQSLNVQSTQRPFTPRDAHRQLFGTSSVRANADNRPPSTFSLHAQNFDTPDSRPGSGTRLSPLNHVNPVHILPKPPANPLEVRRPLIGPRARLQRAGSLPIMPPAETDGKDGPAVYVIFMLDYKNKWDQGMHIMSQNMGGTTSRDTSVMAYLNIHMNVLPVLILSEKKIFRLLTKGKLKITVKFKVDCNT
uniref:Uncharacterized protein n=1 Tax=Periophthalmus magnuspinnatus TaxID=409849 RepID=A0A3B4B5J4_9GOBI